MNLVFVTKATLPDWYEKARPFLKQMADGRRLTEEAIRAEIEAGSYWLVIAVEGDECRAALIGISTTWATGFKEFVVVGLTGKRMRDWLHLEPELRAKLKATGHQHIKPIARLGWARVMKTQGYVANHVVLGIDL